MRPVHRADNLTTFLCCLSWNLGASASWSPQGLSRPVMGLLYLYICTEPDSETESKGFMFWILLCFLLVRRWHEPYNLKPLAQIYSYEVITCQDSQRVWTLSHPSEIERDFIWIHSRIHSCSTNGCEILDFIAMGNFLNIEWTERMFAHAVVGLECRDSWIMIFRDLDQFERLRPF
jgi:hypothetical protein